MAVYVFGDWENDLHPMRPHPQHLDNHFGLNGLGIHHADILAPPPTIPHHPRLQRCPRYRYQCCLPQQNLHTTGSVVKHDKNHFQVNLDVQQFTPDEILVKVVDNCIVVEAKHEEKPDEHGFISRNFVRRYVVPEGHDIQKVASSLSSDGILTITAPKIAAVDAKERVIPITHTGPHKNIQSAQNTAEIEDKKKEEN